MTEMHLLWLAVAANAAVTAIMAFIGLRAAWRAFMDRRRTAAAAALRRAEMVAFVTSRMTRVAGSQVDLRSAYSAYVAWAEGSLRRAVSEKRFRAEMVEAGFPMAPIQALRASAFLDLKLIEERPARPASIAA
ncbi:hypothetical protein ATO13_08621 [Stappia sp. 22II-S9-Z10]|nr:hypothetical protein ATO13_08621 [Stappia sp. 22II-S9-Z10]